MLRCDLLASCAAPFALLLAGTAAGQDLQNRPVAPPTAATNPAPAGEDEVNFTAAALDYDNKADVVTATGDVRMTRQGNRLRADKVVWNRTSGKVLATGNIAVTNPQGDVAYGDSIELTDALKDGVVENMLVVLDDGGRLAAERGTRQEDGTIVVEEAAYTPCSVTNPQGCPKSPSWQITAVRVIYRPDRRRIYYKGARLHLLGLPALPLPQLSSPVGDKGESGLLSPIIRYTRANGLELAVPYYIGLEQNRGLTITPHIYSGVLPMIQAQYDTLGTHGSFRVTAYATESRRTDNLTLTSFYDSGADTEEAFRGYLDGIGRYQLTPNWSISGSLRLVTDRTFLRRYEISGDDRLRSTASVEHIDRNSYLGITGWYVETLRVNDAQGAQPIALPEIDYRRRIADPLLGGVFTLQANTLGITRSEGQDTQRAFVSAQWDLTRITRFGQQVTLTALARGDAYHSANVLDTIPVYRGLAGFHTRAIGTLAMDVKWPLIGEFLGGTQRLTPQVQIVATPHVDNSAVPNEDSRAVDLEDSNLFALNRFPGYDRYEDSSRVTYGVEWALDFPGLTIDTTIGQSYRLSNRASILYEGTGLSDRASDIVGRTEIRFRDFVSFVHRYRIDKDDFTVRRNEVDATVGSRQTYVTVGYLRLDRDIFPSIEDLEDHTELRLAGRVQISRFWSAFASSIIDLTGRDQDPLSISDGFSPVRHRAGVQYQDDCLRIGFTWRRDYVATGDARSGNSFLLTLALTNLGR
ncbi:LPS-assembly protein LptD [Sphingomonas bacterium]|uniref:LPS-assembly protein LptD n=1 Tax=Sphingomonas bacterium TaxID=1895847 RepID=UPI0020C5E23C|nr:LPS assembly protein LptD [Sphingomonas bacterium]